MPILFYSRFSPLRGGHAPGDVREAFLDGLEALSEWRTGTPEPTVELRGREVPFSALLGLVWNCSDALPSGAKDALEGMNIDLGRGTYGAAARRLKPFLAVS